MASYNTRSTHGKRKSENQDEIQAELSEPEPLTEPSAPLTFAQRINYKECDWEGAPKKTAV